MKFVVSLLLNAIAIVIAAYVLPGIHVDSFLTAILVAVVLGIINTIIKPVLVILTLPITIITLGIFYLVLNALMILLTAAIVKGFTVDNFWWALLFSIVLSIINSILSEFSK